MHSRHVASRPIEASNKPNLYGVTGDREHNWDAGGRSLSRERRKHSGCDDHSHLKLDQISRQLRESVGLVTRPAIFNHKVPAFNVTGLVQTSSEAGQSGASDSGDPSSSTRSLGLPTSAPAPRAATPPRRRGA